MAIVLVVDDEPDVRELIQANLEADGHKVVLAADGREALANLQAIRPDVIVLDVMMPSIDGWEVLERLKREADEELTTIPVLMLTARGEPEDRLRGGIEGAIRYLVKPFDPDELCREVREALEGDPEPAKRRRVQRASLEQLARLERGAAIQTDADVASAEPRPHLTRFEHVPSATALSPELRAMRQAAGELSDKQRELLDALRATASVSDAATQLGVSRSNVYASLRRIGRKLGTRSVTELLHLVRQGDLLGPAS
jgi:DNA-binding response OmpR family regulator/DNA-binding CsgD family transcriptional regulator